MAKVFFNPMLFKFKDLVELVKNNKPADFDSLVFQPEIVDPTKVKDEYILTAYVVNDKGVMQFQVDSNSLIPNTHTHKHEHSIKLFFANYPLSRSRIDVYYKLDPDAKKYEYLSLEPKAFSQDARYASFEMTLILKGGGGPSLELASDELQPSPPANAG